MKHPKIVGLTGPKRVGKTTVANILANHAGFSALAFGDLLRHEAALGFLVDVSLFTDDGKKDVAIEALAIERCVALGFVGAMVQHYRPSPPSDFDIQPLDPLEHLQGFELDPTARLMHELTKPRSPREIMILWAEVFRKPNNGAGYFDSAVVNKVYLQQSRHQLRHVVHDVRFPTNAKAIRDMGGVIWQITKPGCIADKNDPTETDGSEYAPEVVIDNAHGLDHLQAIVLGEWMRHETGLGWKDLANIGVVAIERV